MIDPACKLTFEIQRLIFWTSFCSWKYVLPAFSHNHIFCILILLSVQTSVFRGQWQSLAGMIITWNINY